MRFSLESETLDSHRQSAAQGNWTCPPRLLIELWWLDLQLGFAIHSVPENTRKAPQQGIQSGALFCFSGRKV